MRVIRFMSTREILLLTGGHAVENSATHDRNATNSMGFCFWIDNNVTSHKTAIINAARSLSGITTMDVCLVAEVKKKRLDVFKESYGIYSSGKQKELCTTQYSLDDFDDWSIYVCAAMSHPGMPGLTMRSSNEWQQAMFVMSGSP